MDGMCKGPGVASLAGLRNAERDTTPAFMEPKSEDSDNYQIVDYFVGGGTSFGVIAKEEHPIQPRRSGKVAWRK